MDAMQCIMTTTSIVFDVIEQLKKIGGRRWWVRPVNIPRDRLGFFETCTRQLQARDEDHFFKATRMDVTNFNVLLELLRNRLQRFSKRRPIVPEIRLSLTLLFLAQGCNVQVLAWCHKIGISTVRKIIYETCDAIWDELKEIYMAAPSVVDFQTIANMFYAKTGMPNCLGAIDGKHVRLVCPKRSGSLHYNYKKYFSIVLLAACDPNYTFMYVDVGALGSQSDGGIFVRSEFGRKILNRTLEVPPDSSLPNGTILPHYFVADNAFPLKTNLMRPYPGRNLSQDKLTFNKKLSKARVYIENAFGILASRWRVLHTTIHAEPENAVKIVLATVILHNFLMLKRDSHYFRPELVDRTEGDVNIEGDWRRDAPTLSSVRQPTANRSVGAAFRTRDILKDFLNSF